MQGSEETLLVRLFVDDDLRMHMRWLCLASRRVDGGVLELSDLAVRAGPNVAEPLVAVVLFVIVYGRWFVRRRVEAAAALLATALANESTVLATTTQQLPECAASTGLDKQHAPNGGTRFAREKAKNGLWPIRSAA